MPQVSHCCKTCPTTLNYFQRTNRRIYCKPCKRLADNKSARDANAYRKCVIGSRETGSGDWDQMERRL